MTLMHVDNIHVLRFSATPTLIPARGLFGNSAVHSGVIFVTLLHYAVCIRWTCLGFHVKRRSTYSYFLTNLISYILNPWSRVFLVKLTVSQPVKNFPAFYATRRFITAFTSARHLSLSQASSIQSIPTHPTS